MACKCFDNLVSEDVCKGFANIYKCVLLNNSKKSARKTCFDGLDLGLLCIGSPEPIERNPFNCVRLSSICSIEFDLFGNRTHRKCGVRFRSIEFDFRTFDLLCRVYSVD